MPASHLIEISLLLAGSVVCLIAAFCIQLSRNYNGINYNQEKQKWMFWMQLSAAVLLASDALALQFRGYPGTIGYWAVRITNFIVFIQTNVVLFFFHQHVVCHLFPQMEERKKIKRVKWVCYICTVGMALACISQFTGLYYTFDAQNFYHRSAGYIISFLLPALGMIVDLSMLLQYRSKVNVSIFSTMLSYITLPVVAAVIQLFLYGVSLINLSIGLSMVLMYITAVREQNEEVESLSKSKAQMKERLEIETILNECVAQLSTGKNLTDSIKQLLAIINGYFDADRTYIFETDYKRNIVCNTYEYAKDQVTQEKDNLQEVPIEIISEWIEAFQKSKVYYIPDLEQKKGTPFYQLARAQNINRLLEVSLETGDEIMGFLGVDNPRKHYDDATLLSSLRFFVINSLEKKKEQEYLEYLSYRDMLTKLYNRNKYIDVLEVYKKQKPEKIGVSYIDLNGLKKINDQQGHEAGDSLIRRAGKVIASFFPEQSYRIGGDEFVILVAPIDSEVFFQKMRELSVALKKNSVSVSMGILWRDVTEDIEDMLHQADQSMYEQKERYHQQFGYYRR